MVAFENSWARAFFDKVRSWRMLHKAGSQVILSLVICWTNVGSRVLGDTLTLKPVYCEGLVVLNVASPLFDVEEGWLVNTRLFFFGQLIYWREFRIPNFIFVSFLVPLLLNKLCFNGGNAGRVRPRARVEGGGC